MQHASTCSCSRRNFLRGCGLTLTGFGVASLFPTALIQPAMAGLTAQDKRLLFIFLRGGNDGINSVIPHGDAAYSVANRPTLYISPGQGIDLNGFASLHPALGDLMDGFNAGDLAVLHRVGYENNSQSHFDGQRIWENGDPTQSQLFEGWLYRYMRDNVIAAGGDLPALTIQSLPPVLLRGEEKFVNIANPDAFRYISTSSQLSAKLGNDWREAFDRLVGLEPYRPILSQTGVKLVDTLDMYDSWAQQLWDPKDPNSGWSLFPVSPGTDQVGFGQGAYPFFAALKVAALSLLEASSDSLNAGTRVAGTQLGGWDLHSGQGQGGYGAHAQLLSWVGYAFKSLRTVFSGAADDPRNYPAIWQNTAVVTLSEFGRTTLENGSAGTDHAAASCMFLGGGSVNGGVYNCDATTWPAGVMTEVQGRYLRERTDFRSVFWEILRDHMGAAGTADAVFPGYESLGLGGQELGLIAT